MVKGISGSAAAKLALMAASAGMVSHIPSKMTKNAAKKLGRPPGSKNKKPKAVAKANVQRNNRILRGATGLITQSAFALHRAPSKKVAAMELVVPTKVFTSNYPIQLGCLAGFQKATHDVCLGTSDLQNLQQLMPNIAPGPPGRNEGTSRLVIKSFHKEYSITNNTNATLELDIYDIILKKDLPNSNQCLSNGQTYTLSPNPEDYWAEGTLASEGQVSGFSPPPSELLGVFPQDSQFFKDYFKVAQKRVLHMPLGSGHRHTVSLTPNYMLTESIASGTAIAAYQGLTVFTMFVVRGFPITDTDAALVTTSSGTLAMVACERTRYCWVADTRSSGYYSDQLTSPVGVNEALINAATGAIDQVRQV